VTKLLPWQDGSETVLLAAGLFSRVDAVDAFLGASLARWDGVRWETLRNASSTNIGIGGLASSLAGFDDGSGRKLFVAGHFSDVHENRNSTRIEYAARLDSGGWIPAESVIDRSVETLAWATVGTNTDLYAGGMFRFGSAERLNHIARWDGARLHALGAGVQRASDAPGATVNALLGANLGDGPALYVAGYFERAGGSPATNVARWDGAAWSPVGGGIDGPFVGSLIQWNDTTGPGLVAAGAFTRAGETRVANIARWDGARWSALGNGLGGGNTPVYALAEFDDGSGPALFAAGAFTTFNSTFQQIRRIAKWDGREWLPVMGDGSEPPPDTILSLAVHDDGSGPALYAGGTFERASDGTALNSVAKWDGKRWGYLSSILGPFTFYQASFLISADDGSGMALFASVTPQPSLGDFNQVLARWDGIAWELLELSAVQSIHAILRAGHPGVAGAGVILGGEPAPFRGQIWSFGRPAPPCRAPAGHP
jgi:hypothetical protein